MLKQSINLFRTVNIKGFSRSPKLCHKFTEFSGSTKVMKAIDHINESKLDFKLNDPQALRKRIFRCKNGKEIKQLLKKNIKYEPQLIDLSVFGSAITKCGELYDIKHAKKILKLMYLNDIKPNVNIYNILFTALAKNEKTYEYPKYLNKMIKKSKITPDIITATTLITGCMHRGDFETAQKVWNDIIIKYKLSATDGTYATMINVYGKAGKIDLAEKTFKEMMETGMKPTLITCRALMKSFANSLEIDSVIKIKEFMLLKGFQLQYDDYTIIMTAYLKNRLSKNALKVYDEYISKTKEYPPNKVILFSKTFAYIQLLEDNIRNKIDNSETDYYYNMVTQHSLDEIRSFYGTKTNIINNLTESIFNVKCLYYNELKNDEDTIVKIFQEYCRNNQFKYWIKCKLTNRLMIDLHNFAYASSKFLIKYLLKYETENVLNMDNVLVLCGKGYHRDPYSSHDEPSQQKGLMHYIQFELDSFNPPIRSKREETNKAVLVLFKEDVINYCKYNDGDVKKDDEIVKDNNTIKYKVFGDKNRKKMSEKLLNELKKNLISEREIEICNENDIWCKYRIEQHIGNGVFAIVDIENNKSMNMNFTSIKYRICE